LEGTKDAIVQGKKRNAPWWTKLFVLFHIICITSWTLPNGDAKVISGEKSPPVFAIGDWVRVWNTKYVKKQSPLQAYLFVTGFWQYWDMFAPNPVQTDYYGTAEIVYKDGSTKQYLYPRVFALSIPSKYMQERYRKYFERARDIDSSYLWPQFALRIAYLNDNVANPPVKVRLTRHSLPIAPYGKPQQQSYDAEMYFEYNVDPKALNRMRTGPI